MPGRDWDAQLLGGGDTEDEDDYISNYDLGLNVLQQYMNLHKPEDPATDLLGIGRNLFLAAIAEYLRMDEGEKRLEHMLRERKELLELDRRREKVKQSPCPYCEAQPGEDCITKNGKVYRDFHMARKKEVPHG